MKPLQFCKDGVFLCASRVDSNRTDFLCQAALSSPVSTEAASSIWPCVSLRWRAAASPCSPSASFINPRQLTETPLHSNKCHFPPDSKDAQLFSTRRNHAQELTAVIKAWGGELQIQDQTLLLPPEVNNQTLCRFISDVRGLLLTFNTDET